MTDSHAYNIRCKTSLTGKDIRVLVEKGNQLFAMLKLTEDAKLFLKCNADLAEVIEKW